MKLLCLLILLLSISHVNGQERWEATDYRNENWNPNEGKFFFSEEWTYSFINENLPLNDPKREGRMSFFVDPSSGTILLTREASSYGDDMTEWVLVFPEGRYSFGMVDEFGKRRVIRKSLNDLANHEEMIEMHQDDFDEYVEKGLGNLTFGVNKYGWPILNGTQYIKSYFKSTLITELYLTEIPFSLKALYLVKNINPDLSFLFDTQYGYLLPDNYLILSEATDLYGKQVSYRLESMSHASHFLDTMGYGTDH